ncbi:hypothetical protein LG274_11545 [Micrococcus antarcticus]|uniref:hypothetical protein n=1 Tax=Micrococcus antarcticus TaxID=86171 RepID=UPI00384F363B
MPADENRAFDNLVLLCIEHSYEIDETPDSFPAEMLREWKAAQIAEYDRLQRNWPISDDEATEVLVASKSFDALHAPSTVELARRVEALRLVAERTRGVTRSWAGRWQQLREQTRRSFNAWDDEGNPVYAEPSQMETRPMREGIQSALAEALDEMGPAAEAARIELAAVRVTGRQVALWCDALERAITDLIDTASTWTGRSDPTSDTAFDNALGELQRSVTDLVRASRGEQVAVPELPPVASEPEQVDPLSEHRKLLDEARPFHRVRHRPYDPELRERVAGATVEAAAIPPTAHFLTIGLDTTAALAIAVAGNATEDEQFDLMERDRQRLPICAAAALLQEAARQGDEQDAPAVAADDNLRRLWSETDWSKDASWVGNDVNGQSMMWAFARATSDAEVHDRLAHALETAPHLLTSLVVSCAGWVERLDSQTWNLIGFDRTYREVPPWLPMKVIRAFAAKMISVDQSVSHAEVLNALLRHVPSQAE